MRLRASNGIGGTSVLGLAGNAANCTEHASCIPCVQGRTSLYTIVGIPPGKGTTSMKACERLYVSRIGGPLLITLLILLLLPGQFACAAGTSGSKEGAPMAVKVMVVSMFQFEAAPWLKA